MKKLTESTRAQKQKEIIRKWHLVNLDKQILGREATQIAKLLQGKHKVDYVPYLDSGDYVVVINARKVLLSGKKSSVKTYTYYSGYPGGQKRIVFEELMNKNPSLTVIHAVSGMLPKNKLRARRLTRLYVFNNEIHPYLDKFKVQNAK